LRIGKELGVLGISEMGKSIFSLMCMAGIFISVWLEGCCAITGIVVARRTTASEDRWDRTIAGPSHWGKDVPANMVLPRGLSPFTGCQILWEDSKRVKEFFDEFQPAIFSAATPPIAAPCRVILSPS
jgi:hypothetical protein